MLTSLYVVCLGLLVAALPAHHANHSQVTEQDMAQYRDRVKSMFYHAYNNYLNNAFPYDELRPLTCDGQDTWGSFSLTLIDALDTLLRIEILEQLYEAWRRDKSSDKCKVITHQPIITGRKFALFKCLKGFEFVGADSHNVEKLETSVEIWEIIGNVTEFQRVVTVLQDTVDFDIDVNASVFETNIRVVGGLLSAHLLSKKAGIELEPGWPCSGPLLRMAEDAARKLLPAFDTQTGMPFGTVNLLNGVNPTETPVTCTAGIGTYIIEFATLSRLTGDPEFERVARRALKGLWESRSEIGLVGNHIDVMTSKWVAQDAGIGAGVDSYFEYLVKGAILLQDEEMMSMFMEYNKAIQNYTKYEDWYVWVQMYKGTVSMPIFQSLEAFWPGLLSLIGDIGNAMRTFHNYYTVWKQFGGLPEFYNIPQGFTVDKREGYPLRPELIESAMYLYRATKDPTLLQLGRDAIESIERISKVDCGFATIKDVRDHKLDNRMESFFVAETIKYLYLLFDPDNFIHNDGSEFDLVVTPYGECILGAGGYVFNTEAHPIDPAALHCCKKHNTEKWEVEDLVREFFSGKAKEDIRKEAIQDQSQQDLFPSRAQNRTKTKRISLLQCPSQPFSSKLSILGQVFLE